MSASLRGGAGGYSLAVLAFLTPAPLIVVGDSVRRQFDWGGRLLKVTEALKGSLRMVGNHS